MNKNTGFTLIEVLIAVLLLAGGLLGLAALQATSLRNNQSAYYRSQATQLAYDMADRIRANPDVANANGLTLAAYVATTSPAAQASCSNTTGCTPALMAQNDRAQWLTNITAVLPSGTGTITNITDATVVPITHTFTITVSWDDNRSGAVDTNFAMSFQL